MKSLAMAPLIVSGQNHDEISITIRQATNANFHCKLVPFIYLFFLSAGIPAFKEQSQLLLTFSVVSSKTDHP